MQPVRVLSLPRPFRLERRTGTSPVKGSYPKRQSSLKKPPHWTYPLLSLIYSLKRKKWVLLVCVRFVVCLQGAFVVHCFKNRRRVVIRNVLDLSRSSDSNILEVVQNQSFLMF